MIKAVELLPYAVIMSDSVANDSDYLPATESSSSTSLVSNIANPSARKLKAESLAILSDPTATSKNSTLSESIKKKRKKKRRTKYKTKPCYSNFLSDNNLRTLEVLQPSITANQTESFEAALGKLRRKTTSKTPSPVPPFNTHQNKIVSPNPTTVLDDQKPSHISAEFSASEGNSKIAPAELAKCSVSTSLSPKNPRVLNEEDYMKFFFPKTTRNPSCLPTLSAHYSSTCWTI